MLNLLKEVFPVFVLLLIIYIFLLPFIASWKLFKKVGIPGWKSLIPVYNSYLVFKICGMFGFCFIPNYVYNIIYLIYDDIEKIPKELLIVFVISLIFAIIINVIRGIKLSKAFNKGKVFMIGLILLPEIFEIILGMDRSKYNGPYRVKE